MCKVIRALCLCTATTITSKPIIDNLRHHYPCCHMAAKQWKSNINNSIELLFQFFYSLFALYFLLLVFFFVTTGHHGLWHGRGKVARFVLTHCYDHHAPQAHQHIRVFNRRENVSCRILSRGDPWWYKKWKTREPIFKRSYLCVISSVGTRVKCVW